jgi:hypothetical protein
MRDGSLRETMRNKIATSRLREPRGFPYRGKLSRRDVSGKGGKTVCYPRKNLESGREQPWPGSPFNQEMLGNSRGSARGARRTRIMSA